MIIIAIFFLIYFLMDALHDTWSNEEKELTRQAAAYHASFGATYVYKDLMAQSLRYNKMKHAIDAWIKGIVLGFVAYLFNAHTHEGWQLILMIGKYTLFGASLRWLWFDVCWNIFNKHPFFYRGTVATTDTLKLADWLYFSIKFILVIGSVLFIILPDVL